MWIFSRWNGDNVRSNPAARFSQPHLPSQEAVLAAQGDAANGALDRVAVHFDASICKEEDRPIPVLGILFEGLAGWGFD